MPDGDYQSAYNQVQAELQAQMQAYQSQIAGAQSGQQQALEGVGNMFSSLMPYVQNAATFVGQQYQQGMQNEMAIYSAAMQRMQQMSEGRAAYAQAFAQKMGGPVAVGEFTAGVLPHQLFLAQAGAGDLLHSNMFAQAGVQEAAAWAGRVFPLIRTEKEAETRRHYEKQIGDLRLEQARLEASKVGEVNKRFFEMQQANREYELQKAQQGLDKLKADRDWRATLKQLKQEEKRLSLATRAEKRAEASLTGTFGGKPTLESKEQKLREKQIAAELKHMTAQDKIAAREMGLSEKEFAVKSWELGQQSKVNAQKLAVEQRRAAMEIVDAAMNPGSGKTIKQTVTTEVDQQTAILNKKAYSIKGPDGKTHYFLDRSVELPANQIPAIQDPQKLFNLLTGYRIPPKMAENIVESRLGVPEFEPGKLKYSGKELKAMGFSQLRGVAIQLGFKPDPKTPRTRKYLVNYVLRSLKTSGVS